MMGKVFAQSASGPGVSNMIVVSELLGESEVRGRRIPVVCQLGIQGAKERDSISNNMEGKH